MDSAITMQRHSFSTTLSLGGYPYLQYLHLHSSTSCFYPSCTSLSALLRDHVAEVHKGRKPLRCEVPGCDFYTLCDRPGKFMRKHIREGLHGKFGKRKPLPEVDKDALALKYKGIV